MSNMSVGKKWNDEVTRDVKLMNEKEFGHQTRIITEKKIKLLAIDIKDKSASFIPSRKKMCTGTFT